MRQILFDILLIIILAGWSFWLCAWIATRRFLHRRQPAPSGFTPSVSILKPIKGVDANLEQNLAGFCEQDYPSYEILFGVADANDPAIAVIERVRQQNPHVTIHLLVAAPAGANPKSSTLSHLSAEAAGDILVISDADIRVSRDYLLRVVAPLADPKVGVVTCLYRGAQPRSFAAKLEAFQMGATFLPSVVFAHEWLGNCVGMGATLAVRKADLQRLGGYESFRDHLADDYELAERIHGLGLQSRLSDCTVESVLGKTRFADQWNREVRWARGIRTTSPRKYLGLLLTYPIFWSLLLLDIQPTSRLAWIALGATLFIRAVCAYDLLGHRFFYLLPARELLSVAVWGAGLVGRTITWRGQRFTLSRDGRLSPRRAAKAGLLGILVRRLDAMLRRRQRIFEFSEDPDCMFRASIGTCSVTTKLIDATEVAPADRVVDLHLWNEHLPRIPQEGATFAWAQSGFQQAKKSLRLLAITMQNDSRFAGVCAIRGKSVFTPRGGVKTLERFMNRLHFELRDRTTPRTVWNRLHDMGENVLIWALLRTFNPAGLRAAKLNRMRTEAWISRGKLLEHYGGNAIPCDFTPQKLSGQYLFEQVLFGDASDNRAPQAD